MDARPAILVALAISAVASAAAPGCNVYDDSLRDPRPGSTGGAAGSASTGGAGGTSPTGGAAGSGLTPGAGIGFWSRQLDNGCVVAGAPTPDMRPAPTDTTELPAFFLAIDRLRLGAQDLTGKNDSTAWEDLGFDLDGKCTDPGSLSDPTGNDMCSLTEEKSCLSTTSKIPADGHACRDNTFGRFEGDVTNTSEIAKYRLNDDFFNCAVCVGYFTFLIRVTGYNGTDSDDQVRVDLYPSPGLVKPFQLDCMAESWKSGDLCWTDDPQNPWKIDPASLGSGPATGGGIADAAKLFDDKAYVRDGYMVMQLPDAALLWFPTQPGVPLNSFPIIVHRGIIATKISKEQGAWVMSDGTIAGNSKEAEIVEAFRQVGFCEADPLFSVMTSQVHGALDLISDGTVDATQKCDSMSIGVGFHARQATPGPTEAVIPLTECMDRFGSGGAAGAGGSGTAGAGG